jgi:hypothetical protein
VQPLQLLVFADSGKMVSTINRNDAALDGNSIVWEYSHPPGGVYYYRFTTTAGSEYGKVIISK